MYRTRLYFGVRKGGTIIGCVLRSGDAKEMGHYCNVRIGVNGCKTWAFGAEQRIYPFHSVPWGEIDNRQPKDMLPALGFASDGATYCFWLPPVGGRQDGGPGYRLFGDVVSVGGANLYKVPKSLWLPEWCMPGSAQHPLPAARVSGYLLLGIPLDEDLQTVGYWLLQIQQALASLGPRNDAVLPCRAMARSLASLHPLADITVQAVSGLSKTNTSFGLAQAAEGAHQAAAIELLADTKPVLWINDEGVCPECSQVVRISPRWSPTPQSIIASPCQHEFTIRQWVTRKAGG